MQIKHKYAEHDRTICLRCKGNASREKNNQACLKLLFRGAAYLMQRYTSREKNNQACLKLLFRDAAYLMQRYTSREKHNQACLKLLFRGAAYLMQRYTSREKNRQNNLIISRFFRLFSKQMKQKKGSAEKRLE